MNMQSLDIFLTVAALIMGVMLLTGHGDILMRGGNANERKKIYDEAKVQKATGVTMLLFGVITGIDMFLDGVGFKIAYLVIVIVIFVAMIVYIRKKCKK